MRFLRNWRALKLRRARRSAFCSGVSHANRRLLCKLARAWRSAFCSGVSFPVSCTQYGSGEIKTLSQDLQTPSPSKVEKEYSPVFVTGQEHESLIKDIGAKPLSFTGTRVWVMPMEYASLIPLRLNSYIVFYNRTSAGDFTVYESYAVRGGTPVVRRLLKWFPEEESGTTTGRN